MTLRELVAGVAREAAKRARSPHWRTVSTAFLLEHPACAACGTRRLVVAHHVQPVSRRPELELDPESLLAGCFRDHLHVYHGGAYRAWNPRAREDAAALRANPGMRREVEAAALAGRRLERERLAPVARWRLLLHALGVVLEHPEVVLAAWEALGR